MGDIQRKNCVTLHGLSCTTARLLKRDFSRLPKDARSSACTFPSASLTYDTPLLLLFAIPKVGLAYRTLSKTSFFTVQTFIGIQFFGLANISTLRMLPSLHFRDVANCMTAFSTFHFPRTAHPFHGSSSRSVRYTLTMTFDPNLSRSCKLGLNSYQPAHLSPFGCFPKVG